METSKTKLSFFFLTILTISSFSLMVKVAEADDLDCSIFFQLCSGSCWKSGECMRCCKNHGFVHGRHYGFPEGKCSLKHGDGCYCCSSSGAATTPAGFLA
ncbi:unnamed protein product [Urochloa decumbens]|uniref:Uncharacterized protein n=1 Tax=Urochloa decumbens TaxID=240449 RepID=A0ABC9DBN6_9POAL